MVVLVLMDSKNRVLYCGVVTEGNVNTVPLYIRKIITLAATYNAAEAIIAHNHPSGNVMPSPGDIIATRKLNAAMETIDVHYIWISRLFIYERLRITRSYFKAGKSSNSNRRSGAI